MQSVSIVGNLYSCLSSPNHEFTHLLPSARCVWDIMSQPLETPAPFSWSSDTIGILVQTTSAPFLMPFILLLLSHCALHEGEFAWKRLSFYYRMNNENRNLMNIENISSLKLIIKFWNYRNTVTLIVIGIKNYRLKYIKCHPMHWLEYTLTKGSCLGMLFAVCFYCVSFLVVFFPPFAEGNQSKSHFGILNQHVDTWKYNWVYVE